MYDRKRFYIVTIFRQLTVYMYDRKRFYIVTIFRQLTVYMQGEKKLSQLYSLPFGQAVASMHQDEQD